MKQEARCPECEEWSTVVHSRTVDGLVWKDGDPHECCPMCGACVDPGECETREGD